MKNSTTILIILFIQIVVSFRATLGLRCFSGYNIPSAAFYNLTSITCPTGSTICGKVAVNLPGVYRMSYGYTCLSSCTNSQIVSVFASVSGQIYCCSSDNCNAANKIVMNHIVLVFIVLLIKFSLF
jgi:hypothetical protein